MTSCFYYRARRARLQKTFSYHFCMMFGLYLCGADTLVCEDGQTGVSVPRGNKYRSPYALGITVGADGGRACTEHYTALV